MILIPTAFRIISEDSYTVEFLLIVSDKVPLGDETAYIKSTEGSLFVLANMTDHLDDINAEFELDGGSIIPEVLNERGSNIVSLASTLRCDFSKPQYEGII